MISIKDLFPMFSEKFRDKQIKEDSTEEKSPSVTHSPVDEGFCRQLKIVAKKHYNYLLSVEESPPLQISKLYMFSKRCIDLLTAIIGLILLFPLFIVVAIAIKLDSEGNVFFSQKRTGKGERVFHIYKFRTMIQNAESKTGPVWAKKGDPRVTLVGKVLRKWKIDEFPQLFNVIKGDMSLVGPRPERPSFVKKFSEIMPAYKRRHDIVPGITGLAQIKNGYDEFPIDIYRKVRYDVTYIKKMNIWMDFYLLMKTFMILFVGRT